MKAACELLWEEIYLSLKWLFVDYKAEGNKIAGCPREPELCASKVERYEDAFLLLIYPAYSPVKRWIPGEKKVTKEVKKQDAVTLERRGGRKSASAGRRLQLCWSLLLWCWALVSLTEVPSRTSPAGTRFLSTFVKWFCTCSVWMSCLQVTRQ